jgi:hypothetical protein
MYKVRSGGDQPDIAALGHSGNLSHDCVYFVSFHIPNELTYPALIEWFDATKDLRVRRVQLALALQSESSSFDGLDESSIFSLYGRFCTSVTRVSLGLILISKSFVHSGRSYSILDRQGYKNTIGIVRGNSSHLANARKSWSPFKRVDRERN